MIDLWHRVYLTMKRKHCLNRMKTAIRGVNLSTWVVDTVVFAMLTIAINLVEIGCFF